MTEALVRAVTFCFEETELQRLWADVHIQNIASYKTLEKAGFKREGLIRGGKMVNTYCDYYLYGMIKADYIEISPRQVPLHMPCVRPLRLWQRLLPWPLDCRQLRWRC